MIRPRILNALLVLLPAVGCQDSDSADDDASADVTGTDASTQAATEASTQTGTGTAVTTDAETDTGSTTGTDTTTPTSSSTDAETGTDTGTDTESTGDPAYEGFPYMSNFVELDGGLNMHYLDEGTGDPILLMHGVPTQAYLWRNLIPALSQEGRVIAPDLLNFGLSDKTDPLTPLEHAARVQEFVDALGLEQVTIVMQDWGGPVGFDYAANNRDNVKGLVFFEAPIFPFPDMSIVPPFFIDNVLHPETGRAAVVGDNYFIECFLLDPTCGATGRDYTDAEREVYRAPFTTEEDREQLYLLPQYLPFLNTDGHPVLDPDGDGPEPGAPVPGIEMFQNYGGYLMSDDVPKLFIYGDPGLNGSAEFAPMLEMVMPNLTSVGVGGPELPTHHFIQEDAPEELAAAIGEFVAGL